MTRRAPILVTGAPRSGTTFAGSILGLPARVGVLFEPFHPDLGVRGLDGAALCGDDGRAVRVELPYMAEGHPFEPRFRALVEAVLAGRERYKRLDQPGRYGLATELARRVLTSRLALRNRLAHVNPLHARLLLKAPHACLAVEYLHRRMNLACVVLVRHPAATAESWRRLGWCPDLRQFWRQPLLVEHHLRDLPRPPRRPLPPLERAAWAWLFINKVLLDARRRNPDILFVRHEDASREPEVVFGRLYDALGLRFSRRIRRVLRARTSSRSRAEAAAGRPHVLRRDSRAEIGKWRRRLSMNEQAVVREITASVAQALYTEDEW